MTNYEKIMNNMTIENLAYNNVKLVHLNNRELYYLTSSGQLFGMSEYEAAVNHEYNWLIYDDEPKKESETNKALKEMSQTEES